MKAFSFFGVAALLVAFAIPAEARHGDQVYLQVDRRAEHVPLKQLLRQQTGLRARDYELRGVTIHRSKKDVRKARRRHVDAAVNLRVGRAHTGFIGLHGRSTYVRSPRGFEDRAWQLNFTPGTRVKGVTLHLRPVRDHYVDRRHRAIRDWGHGRHSAYNNRHRHGRYCRH